MTELGTVLGLIACTLLCAVPDVASSWHELSDKVGCAVDQATVCIVDDAAEA